MRHVSIDPGKHACSIACWKDCQLNYAGMVNNPFKDSPGKERAEQWGNLGRMVAGVIATYLPKHFDTDPVSLIVEVPQIYPGVREEDPNDLIDLAGVLGAVICAAAYSTVRWSPFPREWKGQLPKEVTKTRVEKKLTDAEKTAIEWPKPRLRHNVYDAIHLGIVYLDRQGLRSFVK